MQRPDWAPQDIDLAMPSAARMYDYYLGGMHNFEIDRRMADQGAQMWPDLPLIMQANRAFLRRAVTFCSQAGITQFLDIGSGIPTAGNVHEIAQHHNPDAKVVYVDIDAVAVAHGTAILAGNPNAAAVQADFTHLASILSNPEVTRLIDFTRPLAVLLVALLHFVPDDAEPAAAIAALRGAMPPGSYLVISHFSNEGPPEKIQQLLAMSRNTPTPLTLRSQAEIAAFFDGFDLVEPGLVYLPVWRPESPDDVDDHPERFNDFAGVARRP